MRTPLFPLDLVLFPGQTLPLHIFEERYKEMLQFCIRNRAPFGIVLVRETSGRGRGTPHSIGTFARVTQVDEIPEGRCVVPAPHHGNCYHIVCVGEERFRVSSLDRREASYLIGEVEPFPDEPVPPSALAMVGSRVSTLFDEYYRGIVALMGGWQREVEPGQRTVLVDMATLVNGQSRLQSEETRREGRTEHALTVPILPEDPAFLANVIASELNVDTGVKQELLETPNALSRLQREAEVLSEEIPRVQQRLEQKNRQRYTAFGMSN